MYNEQPRAVIDLKPGEASVLSFVAVHIDYVEGRSILHHLLKSSTERARRIAKCMFTSKFKGKYGITAKRFLIAAASHRDALKKFGPMVERQTR